MKQTVNEEPNVYSVDNIVGRRVRRGRVEYRVRWKGFTPDQDSWEPFTSLREPCLPLIHDFHIRHRKLYQKKKRFSHPFVAYSKPPGRASNELLDISMQFEKDSDDLTADKSSISSTKSQPPPRSFKKVMESIAIEPASRRSAPSSIDLHSPNSYLSHSTVDPSHSPSLLNSEPDVPHLPLVSDSTTSSNTLTSNCSSNIVNSDTNWLPCTVSDSSSTELSNSGLSRFKIGRKVARDKVFIPKRSRDDFVNTPPPLQKANSFDGFMSPNTSKLKKKKTPSKNDSSKKNKSGITNQQSIVKRDKSVDSLAAASAQEGSPFVNTRKSVTIMLKASPTHEFQSTTSLQYSSPNAKPLPDVTKPVCKKRAQVPVVSPKREPDNSEFQPRCEEKSLISNSVVSKVLSVVVHLRESRRRPIQEVVLALCQKHHDISEDVVLSSLDILVSRGHLHRVESDKGISYRSNPFVVARGDLKPATLSAKIKAKYTGGANERRSKVASSVLVGSKRPHSERSSNHCQSKVARNDPTTNTYQRYSRRSATKSLIASDSSAPNCSCNSDINEKIYFNQSSVIVDNMQMNRDHVHPDKGDYLASIKSPSHELQQGTKIFIVPPASPLNEATFESQMNNLPCHRTEQSGQGSCNTASSLSGYSFQNPGIPQIADSRRSNRQMINHRFRSICVKKNVQGRFTEVWLQSPGSSFKNAFTIQVLEELTIVLNRVTCDPSRLIMISGSGTVFSSGIDLTTITGDLLRSAFIDPPSCDSSHSSSSSSSNACTSHNSSNNQKNGTDSSKPLVPSQTNCSCPHSSCDFNSSSQKNVNSIHSYFGSSHNPANIERLVAALRSFLLTLISFPKPVVVGVNGPAMGLAVAMLPLCDIVYVSDSATFCMPYTKLGQIPEGASTFTLSNLIGMPLANELLLAGRKLSAREALQRGLASDIMFPKSFKQELVLRCQKLAGNSCMAMEITKCMVKMQHRERIEYVINMECKKLLECWQTQEFRYAAMDFIINEMDDFV